MTLTLKSSILVSSSCVTMEHLEEIFISMFLPFKPIIVILVSSHGSEHKSCSMTATFFPFSLALSLFGFNSRWSCQQWSSSWPFFEQCFHVSLYFSILIEPFFFPLSLNLLFPLPSYSRKLSLFSSVLCFPLASRCMD